MNIRNIQENMQTIFPVHSHQLLLTQALHSGRFSARDARSQLETQGRWCGGIAACDAEEVRHVAKRTTL